MNKRARSLTAKLEKRQKILAAAKELFFSKGYHGTRIEMIAKKAGISTGTFYLYYRNKTEIFKALQDEGIDILMNMVQQVVAWPNLGSLEKLEQIVHTYLRFHDEYRKYFDILAILSASPEELKESSSEISKVIDRKTFQFLKMVESVFVDGMEKGDIVTVDSWKATNVFWGIMDGMILLEERRNIENTIRISLKELIEQALQIAFYGISTRSKTGR